GLAVVCALLGGWHDPWKPWLPAGLSLSAALLLGVVAVRTRLPEFVAASGLALNLAAVLVSVGWVTAPAWGGLLANAPGPGAAPACWTVVRIRGQRAAEDAPWLQILDVAILPAFGLLVLGLGPTLGAVHANPAGLNWGALAAVAL